MVKRDPERAEKRHKELMGCIADFLSDVQGKAGRFEHECKANDWNYDAVDNIRDACTKLGFALADLVNWYKYGKKEGC